MQFTLPDKPLKKYLAWLPALAAAIAIFAFSTYMSESITQIILEIANQVRMIDLQKLDLVELYMSLSVPVRKSAHIIEFGGFNVTLLFALYVWDMRGKPWVRQAFLLTFLYACSDELHQIFVPGRAGLVSDVIIDMLGVCVLALVLRAMITRRESRIPGKSAILQQPSFKTNPVLNHQTPDHIPVQGIQHLFLFHDLPVQGNATLLHQDHPAALCQLL